MLDNMFIHLCIHIQLQRKCQLKYEAIGRNGWYAVALQIEDFPSPTAPVPLSSVPVQFLVLVFSSDQPCSQKPELVGVTRAPGSCIAVPFNTTFHEPLIATSGGPDVRCILRANCDLVLLQLCAMPIVKPAVVKPLYVTDVVTVSL